MPAPLRIKLNLQEEETLAELRKAISVPYRTHDRAHMLGVVPRYMLKRTISN